MGTGIALYAVGDVSDEHFEQAHQFVLDRVYGSTIFGDWDRDQGHALFVRKGTGAELMTLGRYYGPGYERGCWPGIYNAIVSLQAALPECDLYYGPEFEQVDLVTDERLAALWEHCMSIRVTRTCRRHGRDWRSSLGSLPPSDHRGLAYGRSLCHDGQRERRGRKSGHLAQRRLRRAR